MAKQAISNKKKVVARSSSFFFKPKIQISIILAITAISYFNILFNDFSLDDQLITENEYVQKGFNGIKDIWTHSYSQANGMNVDFRPLTLTLFAIEYSVFGNNPFIGHLQSLLLYLFSIGLLFVVCIYVFEINKIHPILPFLIVLLFAVHPAHTEVVASYKNMDEMLSFIWILFAALSLYYCFKSENTIRIGIYIISTMLMVYLSILTKFVSMPFMACMFLWLLYKKLYVKKVRFAIVLAAVTIAICLHIYVYRSFLLVRSISVYENPLSKVRDLAMVLGLGFNSILFYLKFLFIPFPLRFYYGYNTIPLEPITSPLPLLSLVLCIALVIILIYSIIKKTGYSFFLFSFLFCLLFYCNLFTRYTGIVSERAMFQFSFFFLAFIIIALYAIIEKYSPGNKTSINKIFLGLYVAFISAYIILTISRNSNWKNTETLILHDMKYLDKSTGATFLAGNNFYVKAISMQSVDTVQSRQWIDLSIYYYKKSLELSPEYISANYKLGMAYRYGKLDFENAAVNYQVAAKQSPYTKGLSREIASLFFLQQKYSEAIPYYENAAKEEPNNIELLFYRALNRYNAKDVSGFLELNEQLLKQFPQTQYPYLNYGTYYFNLKDEAKVVENFETAVKYGCMSEQVLGYLTNYYLKNNNSGKTKYYKDLQQRR